MRKVIGIDLGATTLLAGIIDKDGNILKKTSRDISTTKSKKDVLNKIIQVIDELLNKDIIGVGIGSPGFIDSEEGRVLKHGGNIKDWAGTNIRKEINNKFPNLPVFVGNDANMAAKCESWIGAAKDFKNFLMITIGTGLGGAIYIEKLGFLEGDNYQAGELGHVILYPFGEKCTCGQRGCVEKYISGTAIERIYKERSGLYKRGKDIFQDKNDNIAKGVVEEFTSNLAVYLVSLKNIFDPQAIIIGGGLINSKEYWWNLTLKKYKSYSNDSEGMEILPALYLNDAGSIGAGKLAFENIEKVDKGI